MDYFRDFKQAAGVVFSRKQYDQAISGHSHRWRLHVYIRQHFTASLFKIGDWLAGHLKEVGHKAVYKVKLLQLLLNFCIISAILNVSTKRKKIKVWSMVKHGKAYEKRELRVQDLITLMEKRTFLGNCFHSWLHCNKSSF